MVDAEKAIFDIANERGSTIVFPLPIELMEAFMSRPPRTPPDSHS